MKFRIFILFLFLIQISYSQKTDSIQSYSMEIKGWESYFEGNKEDAKLQFKKAIELDSTNVMAKIGLFNSKSENELSENDYELTKNLPKNGDFKNLMFNLMMSNQVDKQLPDSIKVMRNKYDENYIQFKARLTDSEFKVYDEDGQIRQTGAFKNRKPFGTWKKYGYQNKLHHSFTFSKETDTVVIKYYKPDGDVARKELTTGMPFTNDSKKIREYIFWQENPGKQPEYLFVSKHGFKIFDSENPVEFDESTPDNFIQRKWNSEKKAIEAVIWKNGKQEPYELCEDDGMVISEMVNGVRKTYRWENCKKILIEN